MTFTAHDLPALFSALSFSADKHRSQTRKDAEASPYINHPIQLCVVLSEEGGIDDPTVLMAALLHDTIEDTQTTYDDLLEHFGAPVADVVMEVTDDKALAKADRKRLQVEHASTISNAAKLVKLADKICNVRDILKSPPHWWTLERRLEYFEWSKSVVDALRGVHPKLEAIFDAAYAQKPQLAQSALV
jgi:GTP diphosphokinase / guanosine-3',5'-bis(diphosphate) 3'-diphosphatase